MTGILYVVSGPSGAGKSSIIKKALEKVNGFVFSVSYTTRQKRPGEIDGKDYFYVDEPTFREMINNNEFVEWAEVHGNLYGTSKKFIQEKLDEGHHILLDIDVQGAMNVRKKLAENSVLIFVAPPSYEDLKQRLMLRGTESEEQLKKRLDDAREELQSIHSFDYLLVNKEIEESINQLVSVIISEQLKVMRVEEHLGNYTFFKK